mmetsp:Transcript_21467/g.64092  ORF Transcript_21467/g.64092 Transcript_21467/m.64092 type:complete len:565 (+) Transcript_21467:50-1744(+)
MQAPSALHRRSPKRLLAQGSRSSDRGVDQGRADARPVDSVLGALALGAARLPLAPAAVAPPVNVHTRPVIAIQEHLLLEPLHVSNRLPVLALGALRSAAAPVLVVLQVRSARELGREVAESGDLHLRHGGDLLDRRLHPRARTGRGDLVHPERAALLLGRRAAAARNRRRAVELACVPLGDPDQLLRQDGAPVSPGVQASPVAHLDVAVVGRVEDDLRPALALRARDVGLVVDEHVAPDRGLVAREHEALEPSLAEVLADPFPLLLGAEPGRRHGRRADEHLEAAGDHGLDCFDAALHGRQVAEEALRVEEFHGLGIAVRGHTPLHLVERAVDRRLLGPGLAEALVPVHEHAVHVDEDDGPGEARGHLAVLADHELQAELIQVALHAGQAHLLPQLWAIGELRHLVGPLLDGLGRVLLRADEALDAILHHLRDAGDARRHHGLPPGHALGEHHGRHLVEGREHDDVGPAVEVVDLVSDVVQLDARVVADLPLHLLDIRDLVVANSSHPDDDELDILAVARHGLEALDSEGLVLAGAHDAHAQEGRDGGRLHRGQLGLGVDRGLE